MMVTLISGQCTSASTKAIPRIACLQWTVLLETINQKQKLTGECAYNLSSILVEQGQYTGFEEPNY